MICAGAAERTRTNSQGGRESIKSCTEMHFKNRAERVELQCIYSSIYIEREVLVLGVFSIRGCLVPCLRAACLPPSLTLSSRLWLSVPELPHDCTAAGALLLQIRPPLFDGGSHSTELIGEKTFCVDDDDDDDEF